MKEVYLAGKRIKNRDDFHKEIRESFGFPAYYGGNLDALWDMLTGWIQLPVTLIWEDFFDSRDAMGNAVDPIVNVLKEAEVELDGFTIIFK
ncbi:barstar family protein [Desmospora activa]|uniref:Ribonuclease inhibitor n=1 Tax=Desmospora activa DSM 45169 TaxID=1121389 RepID=A0A2T4Z7Y1_9BACL|nr:barstar family protein [Desmospora activa]PTM57979.1 ribonuclease inhibitor [Desmospora activa DSM 45169]